MFGLLLATILATGVQADSRVGCGAIPCRSNGIPYVTDDGTIIVFPGESFVIAFEIENGKIVSAVPNPAGGQSANTIEVSFKEIDSGMMLSLASHLPSTLKYDARMNAPDDRMYDTSSCPVRAGLSSFESWPHPVKFLELSNFRFQDGGSCE